MSEFTSRKEALFARAIALPQSERRAYLAQACGTDAKLLEEVLALVDAHERPDPSFLATTNVRHLRAEEEPGDLIGRYKLRQKIGEGGCGVVWMAEQEEPVRRRVALKVIKLGMDTKEVVKRFEAERQALALMDHPNIAKVLDGGTTATGRPYFVMQLVRGVTITRFCDDNNLPTKARLALFIQVCHAIQHAHQKGIIHRDIKPSNVLVELSDDVGVPVVIDFGIAKATQGRLVDETLFTAFEQFLGTPVYMSPEQAELNALDVDTRTDIYSLGVLLYELLAGRPPFDPKALQEGGIDHIRRIIRDTEPPPPSTRVRALTDEERATVSKVRDTPAAQLPGILRGDLDWIVMKAMEKNRVRRYQTANALAMDLQRYLAHEPVVARPPGTLYRVQKFTRRHRYGVAAAGAVSAALVAGVIVSTWQAVRATRAERAANRERARVVESHARADNLLDFMLGPLRTEVQKLGKLDLLDMVGERATAYFASFDPSELGDTALLQQAKMLTQIGETRVAQGRFAEAMQAFSTGYQRAASLAERHPTNGNMLFERGQGEYWIGYVHWKRGASDEAQRWFTRYRDTAAALAAMDPGNAKWQAELVSGLHNLAVLRVERGEIAAARADFIAKLAALRRMAAAAPGDLELQWGITNTESWLGSLAERTGDYKEALARFTAEGHGLEEIVRADPTSMRWRFERMDSISFQAGILMITGELEKARARTVEARKVAQDLVTHDASNRDWLLASQRLRLREATLLFADGNAVESAAITATVRAELNKDTGSDPTARSARALLVAAHRLEAEILQATNVRAAEEAAARALELGESLLRAGSPSESVVAEAARAAVVSARIVAERGDTVQSQRHATRALELLEPRTRASNDWRLLDPAARALALLGRGQESLEISERLRALGYRPLTPWPTVAAGTITVRNN